MTKLRSWSDSTRVERCEALDQMQKILDAEMRAVAEDLSAFMTKKGIPFRVEVEARLVVTDNNRDPRLPDPK